MNCALCGDVNEAAVCVLVFFKVIPQQEHCTPLHVSDVCDKKK